ncbi:MAG: hypothetical protein OXF62_17745 [Caldilineaceae bacterium]|nr:hypothetical protein [Caldilineaceae bacterium]
MTTLTPTVQKTRLPFTLDSNAVGKAAVDAARVSVSLPEPPSAGNSAEEWLGRLVKRAGLQRLSALPPTGDYDVGDAVIVDRMIYLRADGEKFVGVFGEATEGSPGQSDVKVYGVKVGVSSPEWARFPSVGEWTSNPGQHGGGLFTVEWGGKYRLHVPVARDAFRSLKGSNEASGDDITVNYRIGSLDSVEVDLTWTPTQGLAFHEFTGSNGVTYLLFSSDEHSGSAGWDDHLGESAAWTIEYGGTPLGGVAEHWIPYDPPPLPGSVGFDSLSADLNTAVNTVFVRTAVRVPQSGTSNWNGWVDSRLDISDALFVQLVLHHEGDTYLSPVLDGHVVRESRINQATGASNPSPDPLTVGFGSYPVHEFYYYLGYISSPGQSQYPNTKQLAIRRRGNAGSTYIEVIKFS